MASTSRNLPHVDTGDYIVVVNVERSRHRREGPRQKYYRHTGYPGGIYETNFTKLQQRFPARARKAVKGMLPKGPARLCDAEENEVLCRQNSPTLPSS